eukprot:g8417.t1
MRQFYVAVGTSDIKLATLIDLIQALFANENRSLAVCCNSRDSLDNIIHAISATKQHTIFTIFSDMTLAEKQNVLTEFQNCVKRTGSVDLERGLSANAGDGSSSCILVATDYSLSNLVQSLELDIAINYDLPHSKEMMVRRFGSLFGTNASQRCHCLVINFVVADAIEKFRNYEEMCEQTINVMPLHVADIFTPHQSSQ